MLLITKARRGDNPHVECVRNLVAPSYENPRNYFRLLLPAQPGSLFTTAAGFMARDESLSWFLGGTIVAIAILLILSIVRFFMR